MIGSKQVRGCSDNEKVITPCQEIEYSVHLPVRVIKAEKD